jgi:hypothetical protein
LYSYKTDHLKTKPFKNQDIKIPEPKSVGFIEWSGYLVPVFKYDWNNWVVCSSDPLYALHYSFTS